MWVPHRLVVANVNRMKRCFVRSQHLQAVADDQRESSLRSSDSPPARTSSSMYSLDATGLRYSVAAHDAAYWDGAEPAARATSRLQREHRVTRRFADFADLPFPNPRV